MFHKAVARGLLAAAVMVFLVPVARADVFTLPSGQTSLQFVTVGNAGNAPDTRYDSTGFGAVQGIYKIGKFEVTTGQYCDLLNAVAASDPYGLYSTYMDTALTPQGCNIKRSGSSGSYTYTVASDWANRPVTQVSWGDAARFANWLSNGQRRTGIEDATTTENGAYDMSLGANVVRKPGAKYFLPSEKGMVQGLVLRSEQAGRRRLLGLPNEDQ